MQDKNSNGSQGLTHQQQQQQQQGLAHLARLAANTTAPSINYNQQNRGQVHYNNNNRRHNVQTQSNYNQRYPNMQAQLQQQQQQQQQHSFYQPQQHQFRNQFDQNPNSLNDHQNQQGSFQQQLQQQQQQQQQQVQPQLQQQQILQQSQPFQRNPLNLSANPNSQFVGNSLSGYNFFNFAPKPPMPVPQSYQNPNKRNHHNQKGWQGQQKFGGDPYKKRQFNYDQEDNANGEQRDELSNNNNQRKMNNNNQFNKRNNGNNNNGSNNNGNSAEKYQKKPLTEEEKEEIRKWIEQRKRNYPSQANIDRKKQEDLENEQYGTANKNELSSLEQKLRKKIIISNGSIKKLEIKQKHLDMIRKTYTEGDRIKKKNKDIRDHYKDPVHNFINRNEKQESTKRNKEKSQIEKVVEDKDKLNQQKSALSIIKKIKPNSLFKAKVRAMNKLKLKLAEKRKACFELVEQYSKQQLIEQSMLNSTSAIIQETLKGRDSDDDQPIELPLVGFKQSLQQNESLFQAEQAHCIKPQGQENENVKGVESVLNDEKEKVEIKLKEEKLKKKNDKAIKSAKKEEKRSAEKKNELMKKTAGKEENTLEIQESKSSASKVIHSQEMNEKRKVKQNEQQEKFKIEEMVKELKEKRDKYSEQLETALSYKNNSSNFRYKPNTLLTNLVLDEIYRERNTLLQSIRFIVANNFFDELPTPLQVQNEPSQRNQEQEVDHEDEIKEEQELECSSFPIKSTKLEEEGQINIQM